MKMMSKAPRFLGTISYDAGGKCISGKSGGAGAFSALVLSFCRPDIDLIVNFMLICSEKGKGDGE